MEIWFMERSIISWRGRIYGEVASPLGEEACSSPFRWCPEINEKSLSEFSQQALWVIHYSDKKGCNFKTHVMNNRHWYKTVQSQIIALSIAGIGCGWNVMLDIKYWFHFEISAHMILLIEPRDSRKDLHIALSVEGTEPFQSEETFFRIEHW